MRPVNSARERFVKRLRAGSLHNDRIIARIPGCSGCNQRVFLVSK